VYSGPVPTAAPGSSLICRVGQRLLAIELGEVLEVMRPLAVQVLAEMPVFVVGVTTIRGSVAPVIDLGRLIGVTDSVPTRFVTARVNGRIVALTVDEVVGVQRLTDDVLEELPLLLQSADREIFSAIASLDSHLLLVLQSAHLLPDSAWAALKQVTTS
jgi:chemotaxis signal transduction protein